MKEVQSMKTTTKLITLLASVTLLTACGNNQKAEDSFTNNKEPQTEQTTQSTETSKPTETTETTEQKQETETDTTHAYVVSTEDYLEMYHPQLGGTYPIGTKAFVYNYMQGKTQVHTAVIPTSSTEAGVAIFENQREATLFTQWLNSVNDKNTMTYDMQTNLDYFYTNVYTNY